MNIEDHATFLGMQETTKPNVGMELWNLVKPVGGHPVNSTLSRKTLEAALETGTSDVRLPVHKGDTNLVAQRAAKS